MMLAMINSIIHKRIDTAKELADSGDNQGAEKCYKETLSMAQNIAGEKSALAGSVFLELADFYEVEGREAEAQVLWECIREILIYKTQGPQTL